MNGYQDAQMNAECPAWGGVDQRAAAGVFDDLTAYLKQPVAAIAEAYWRERAGADHAAQQRVAAATEEAPVLAYYADTPIYLYQLSYWEACHDKQAWFQVVERACRRYGLTRVLDFGGGVGGLACYLGARGIRCDYLDVGGKTFEYAGWRFRRHGLPVRQYDVTQPASLPTESYDAVVTWDVLEHLFDLDGALATIARLIRPGGWFLHKSTFAHTGDEHEHVHLEKHACYHDIAQFNELVCRHGFGFVGQLKPSALSRVLRQCGWSHAVAGIRVVPRLKHGGNFLVHRREGT